MFIVLSLILLLIYLYKTDKLKWILFKYNLSKLKLYNGDNKEIIQILIEVLNKSGISKSINYNNILLTFNSQLDDSKLECTIYSWINDTYEKFPCQFIYNKSKNEIINDRYKIIVNMDIWKGKINIKTLSIE